MLQALINGLGDMFVSIANVLPTSPFKSFNELTLDSELLSALAWIIPFPQIVSTLEAWTTAVGLFYVYMIILRWVKAIG